MSNADGNARPHALSPFYAARGIVDGWRGRRLARRGLAGSCCSEEMHTDARLRMPLVRDRGLWLERLCAETAPGEVAHIGCTDSPYTQERLAAEVLLHQRLVKLAPVTGFDIDADALELLRRGLPRERFVLADVTAGVPESERGRYQLVVAGEVLEHVPDADAFLQRLPPATSSRRPPLRDRPKRVLAEDRPALLGGSRGDSSRPSHLLRAADPGADAARRGLRARVNGVVPRACRHHRRVDLSRASTGRARNV